MHLIDISSDISIESWEPEKVERKVINHKKGANKLGKSYLHFQPQSMWRKIWVTIFSKAERISYKDFPGNQGLSQMIYTLSTHTGTHIDAPFHYGKRDKGGRQRTISDLPLEYFWGNAVLIDFSNDKQLINEENVKEKLKKMNYSVKKNDIVLINTGASVKVGTRNYFVDYRAIEVSAVKYLTSLGVKVIGTDAFSFDPPFMEMINEYKRTKQKKVLWPAHFYGRERPYIQIERLKNLERINRNHDFKVCCFPIKLKNADAAWCRAVALVE